MGSLIYILFTTVGLCFSVHKLAKFPSSNGKVHLYGLVYFLGYIREKNNLKLKYYAKIEYSHLSDLLIQAIIESEKQLMLFSNSRCHYCLDTGRITGFFIVFYQGVPISHCTHVPGPVSQFSAENEYNSAWTAGMALAHFIMITVN